MLLGDVHYANTTDETLSDYKHRQKVNILFTHLFYSDIHNLVYLQFVHDRLLSLKI